jgi:hypothetical protein
MDHIRQEGTKIADQRNLHAGTGGILPPQEVPSAAAAAVAVAAQEDPVDAFKKELELWSSFNEEMAFVNSNSQLYAASKAEDPGNTLIHPILAAFSAGSSLEESLAIASMLAVISKDKPGPDAIFRLYIDRFCLSPGLKAAEGWLDAKGNSLARLEDCYRLADFLHCSKPFIFRVLQVWKAEEWRLSKRLTRDPDEARQFHTLTSSGSKPRPRP